MSSNIVSSVAAFTKQGVGGNRAGVVLDAQGIAANERQRLASQAGYSETAFVELRNNDLRIEFFTPTRQIDLCGHATLGAFSLMRDKGIIRPGSHQFHSTIGVHSVQVLDGTVGLWQEQRRFETVIDSTIQKKVLQSLRLSELDMKGPLHLSSNGSAFLLIELADIGTLSKISPDFEAIDCLSGDLDITGFYVFARKSPIDIEARMFAPRYGIPEESATGMAAGALALALYRESGLQRLSVHQGHLMPSPSPALLMAEVCSASKVLVTGSAMLCG
jgi:PhzF family phenazine biosynthesis protein